MEIFNSLPKERNKAEIFFQKKKLKRQNEGGLYTCETQKKQILKVYNKLNKVLQVKLMCE